MKYSFQDISSALSMLGAKIATNDPADPDCELCLQAAAILSRLNEASLGLIQWPPGIASEGAPSVRELVATVLRETMEADSGWVFGDLADAALAVLGKS